MYIPPPNNFDRLSERWNDNVKDYTPIINNNPFSLYDQPCIAAELFKNNPGLRVAMISCPCPRCSIMC